MRDAGGRRAGVERPAAWLERVGAERGDRSPARGAAARASWRRTSSRPPRPPIRRPRCWCASAAGWCGARWRCCRGRSGGRRCCAFTPSCRSRPWPPGWARARSRRARACSARSPACARGSDALRAIFVRAGRAGRGAGPDRRRARSCRPRRARSRLRATTLRHRRASARAAACGWWRCPPAGCRDRARRRAATRRKDVTTYSPSSASFRATSDVLGDVQGPDGERLVAVPTAPRHSVADRDPAALRARDGEVARGPVARARVRPARTAAVATT